MALKNAVALITGGVGGFGRKFTKELLNNGAKVIIADLITESGLKFEEECGATYGEGRVKFLKCNVRSHDELMRTFEDANQVFGGLDIVCNNAGMISIDNKRNREHVDINLTAVIEGTYKAVDLMSKKNGGRGGTVVNVASAAGYNITPSAVYSATKFGVVAFTRCFKLLPHFVEDGVRVNCICPAFCDTNMVRTALDEYPHMKGWVDTVGMVDINSVVKAFMHCVQNEQLNARAIAIAPPDKVFQLTFPPAKARL